MEGALWLGFDWGGSWVRVRVMSKMLPMRDILVTNGDCNISMPRCATKVPADAADLSL